MVDINRLKELLSDKEFTNNLANLDEASDVQALLNDNGIELSVDEINQTKDLLLRYQNNSLTSQEKTLIDNYQNNDELSDSDLENVNGGFISFYVVAAITAVLVTGALEAHIWTRGRW